MPHDPGRNGSSSSSFVQFLRRILHWGSSDDTPPSHAAAPASAKPPPADLRPPTPSKPLSYPASVSGSVMSGQSYLSSDHSDSRSGGGSHTAVAFNVDSSTITHSQSRAGLSTKSGAADSASVFTIASSSKRPRRRSLDTNASTRALAAESIFSKTESIDTDY